MHKTVKVKVVKRASAQQNGNCIVFGPVECSKAIPEIIGATLLSIGEAERLPDHLRKYSNWWWLRAPGLSRYTAASICNDGSVYYTGDLVYNTGGCVRPALRIRNFESSDFKIGDRFKFGGKEFEIISDNLAFCTGDIGRCLFRTDWRAPDANFYEASDVKKKLDRWFHECEQCEKARVNCK